EAGTATRAILAPGRSPDPGPFRSLPRVGSLPPTRRRPRRGRRLLRPLRAARGPPGPRPGGVGGPRRGGRGPDLPPAPPVHRGRAAGRTHAGDGRPPDPGGPPGDQPGRPLLLRHRLHRRLRGGGPAPGRRRTGPV